MSQLTPTLKTILTQLEAAYGTPEAPRITDPFAMILHENVAYLVDDARRDQAFEALCKNIGTHPANILAATPAQLNAQAQCGGMNPHGQIAKLLQAAQIALRDFNGDLTAVLTYSIKQAKAHLKKFPGIGEPGAEKILLFNQKLPVLALESNGLRVMTRVGYGKEEANYAATYKSVQEAVAAELPQDCAWLIRAHQLLRQHGKERCKRTKPKCVECPLAQLCRHRQNELAHGE